MQSASGAGVQVGAGCGADGLLSATRIGQSSLISTNLDYTDLSAPTFIATNLAGASLVGATTDGTTIDATSTCPDQSPPATTGAPVLATACRLR